MAAMVGDSDLCEKSMSTIQLASIRLAGVCLLAANELKKFFVWHVLFESWTMLFRVVEGYPTVMDLKVKVGRLTMDQILPAGLHQVYPMFLVQKKQHAQ